MKWSTDTVIVNPILQLGHQLLMVHVQAQQINEVRLTLPQTSSGRLKMFCGQITHILWLHLSHNQPTSKLTLAIHGASIGRDQPPLSQNLLPMVGTAKRGSTETYQSDTTNQAENA